MTLVPTSTGNGASAADGEVSLLELGTVLVHNRWRIFWFIFAGGLLAALSVAFRPPIYSASASFTPEGATDAGRTSGLANLAGQFGISLNTGNPSRSPDFYVQLIKSRETIVPIARQPVAVREMGGKTLPLADLIEIDGTTPEIRDDKAVEAVGKMIGVSAARTTGIVSYSVSTRWPSVSLAISKAILQTVNDFNVKSRQTQAMAERKFVEGQLAAARIELRAAEERLGDFRRANRQILNSVDLSLQEQRLQREVLFQQQVVTSLMQSYEDVRIREVRDTPTISVVESPFVHGTPDPRRRLQRGLLGLAVGAVVGIVVAFMSDRLGRRRQAGDARVQEFQLALRDALRFPLRLIGRR